MGCEVILMVKTAKGIGSLPQDMTRDRALRKMSNLARAASVLCRVIGVLQILAVVLWLGWTAFRVVPLALQGDGSLQPVTGGDAIGVAFVQRDGKTVMTIVDSDGRATLALVLSWLAYAAALAIGSRFFQRISLSRRPFERARALDLAHIGMLLVVIGVVVPFASAAITFAGLLAAGYQGSYSVPLFLHAPAFITGLSIMVLARVFEYGCILQEQDDRLL